jgi:hypothetical protein
MTSWLSNRVRETVTQTIGDCVDGPIQIAATRKRVLLHLMARSKEDGETVTAFFRDMRSRGLGDPLLVVSDGAPGIIKAIEVCFPRSERQRCIAHRLRNLAAKVPEDIWPKFKTQAIASYQASSRAIARDPVVANVAGDHADSSELQQGVRRFARSALDIARMEEHKLDVLPHQVQAHERASAALDGVRPHASRDLAYAIARDPALGHQAAIGRTRAAIRAMETEAAIRANPELRADRFVARWQSLAQERLRFDRSGDWHSEGKIRSAMGDLAKSLHRDPQLESILRNRGRELGIPTDRGRGIGQNLLDSLGLGRGRGLSL